jgi:hypothetical protein
LEGTGKVRGWEAVFNWGEWKGSHLKPLANAKGTFGGNPVNEPNAAIRVEAKAGPLEKVNGHKFPRLSVHSANTGKGNSFLLPFFPLNKNKNSLNPIQSHWTVSESGSDDHHAPKCVQRPDGTFRDGNLAKLCRRVILAALGPKPNANPTLGKAHLHKNLKN